MYSYTELARIARTVGARADYVQGAGGGVRVALDARRLAAKLPGVRMADVSERGGYEIRERTPADGALGDFVLHTEAVYANLLSCSAQGAELAEKIFAGADFSCAYLRRGEDLASVAERGRPQAVFLENNGLLVHADGCVSLLELHQRVNEQIMKYFGIALSEFPKPDLVELSEDRYESHAPLARGAELSAEAVRGRLLWPGQRALAAALEEGRLVPGACPVYLAGGEEARALDETLLAWLFVTDRMRELGLKLSPIDISEDTEHGQAYRHVEI